MIFGSGSKGRMGNRAGDRMTAGNGIERNRTENKEKNANNESERE